MSILLGHASIDERGRAAGGAAGDQTGREVCTRDWYDKGWHSLLRPKSAALAEKSAAACEKACRNDSIGYDQSRRNTLYAAAKAASFDLSAVGKCQCDCSSLMHVCAIAGGAAIPYEGNGLTTRTMEAAFAASGAYEKLTDSRYLRQPSHLRRGDILVKNGSHTAMVLQGAEQNCALALPVLSRGGTGDTVKAMEQLLAAYYPLRPGGCFGADTEHALRQFQRDMNLTPDGLCGRATWSALLGLEGVG